MNRVKLPEVCELIMGQSPDSTSYNKSKEGLPFYQGNANFGPKYPTPTVWCSLPKKIARNNDILISVRAPIGDLNFANEECCIGRGLAALRIKDNSKYSKEYLFAFLKSIARELQRKGTGSTFTAIGKTVLEDLEINVPSLPEQQKIAAHLDSIQSAIDNKKQQLQQLDELVKSKFVEMFGDVVQNSKNWDLIEFEQLGELARGVSKHRPRGAPELLGGKYPLIQTGDVANCDTYITEYTSTYSELGLAQSKMWKARCLCITIAANIAKTGILTFDACFPDSVVGFIPNEKVNELYMHLWFSFFQSILEYQAPQTAQKNLNMATLGKLKICVPPIELQNTFAAYVQKIDSAKSIIKTQLNDLNELLESKMDFYFGE